MKRWTTKALTYVGLLGKILEGSADHRYAAQLAGDVGQTQSPGSGQVLPDLHVGGWSAERYSARTCRCPIVLIDPRSGEVLQEGVRDPSLDTAGWSYRFVWRLDPGRR